MQVPEVGETRVAAPAESILSMVVPVVATCHTNSLICHRIAHDAIAVAERAIHRPSSTKRESSIASADVLAKMRIGSKERSEAKRYLSVAMVRERESDARCARCVRSDGDLEGH